MSDPTDVFFDRHRWPDALREAWRRRGGGGFTPLQREAIEAGLIDGPGDWLVAAPTSAGKGRLAELAATEHLLRGEKVLWLVPTRALAEALAAELRPALWPAGLRVRAASRDHNADAGAVGRGRFDLLIAVYERAPGVLMGDPDGSARFGLVIADELGTLRDPARGPRLDTLLALTRQSPYPMRRLALAPPAVNAPELAEALGMRLLRSAARPRPLHEGVLELVTGTLRWFDRATGERGE